MAKELPDDDAQAFASGEIPAKDSIARSSPVVIVASFAMAIAGIFLGYALATIGTGDTSVSRAFTATVGYRTWRAVLAANVGIWFAFVPLLGSWLRAVSRVGNGTPIWWIRLVVAYLVGAISVFLLLGMVEGPSSPLSHQWGRVFAITLLGFLTVVPLGALGLLAVWQRALERRVVTPPSGADVIALFELRRYATRFLAALGGLVGIAIIATGQLRAAVVTFDAERAAAPEAVLYFGALFTAFLAALYAPAHGAVESLGRLIRDKAAPVPNKLSGEYLAELKTRSELADELDLGRDAKGAFESAVLIAAPLISGLISFAFGG